MSDTTNSQGADPTANELLASAYLDGEITADERVQVEASPELLDEVERLRQVRAVLGATTEPPPISVREAHLAAALDVWDRMPDAERSGESSPSAGMNAAAAAAISTPSPTSLASRRDRKSAGSTRWLLGAAAGLVVIAGTGVVLRSLDSADDNGNDTALEAEAPAEEPSSEAEIVSELAADDFSGADATAAPIEVNADDLAEEDARTELAADEPAEEEPAEEPVAAEEEAPAEESSSEPAPIEVDASAPEDELSVLETSEDLADFGAIAAYAGSGATDTDAGAPTDAEIDPPFNTCEAEFAGSFEFDLFAGLARYQDQEVVVGIDVTQQPNVVVAFTQTCEFVGSAPLPSEDVFNERRQG